MTTYSPHLQSHLTGRRNPVVTLAIALVAGSAVLGLLVSGVTFLALGLAFALAVPIAQHYTVSISAADIALAGRIAGSGGSSRRSPSRVSSARWSSR